MTDLKTLTAAGGSVRGPRPEAIIHAGDCPGLGADTARSINERVRREWRAKVAANVATAPPLSEEQKRMLAAVGAAASRHSGRPGG